MKRKLILIAMIFIVLGSCAKVDWEKTTANAPDASLTRSEEAHFLDQFQGVPVTICSPKGIGSGSEDLYLTRTGVWSDNSEYVFRMLPKLNGDKAFSQRWYFEKVPDTNGKYVLVSACRDLSDSFVYNFVLDSTFPSSYASLSQYLGFAFSDKAFYVLYKSVAVSDKYKHPLEIISNNNNPSNKFIKFERDGKTYYLRVGYGEQKCYFKENDNSIYRNFRIVSVEDFFLQRVEYSLQSGDGAIPIPSFIDEIVVNNGTPTQQQMTATFSNKVTEQTSFTSSSGESVSHSLSYSMSFELDVPFVDTQHTLNTTASSNSNWNYTTGETQSQEDSRQYSFTLVVPGNSSYRATISVARYETQASYKATFRGQTTGSLIEETGKWNGISAGLITYDIIDNSSNELVTRIYGTPDEAVDLTKSKGKILDYRQTLNKDLKSKNY